MEENRKEDVKEEKIIINNIDKNTEENHYSNKEKLNKKFEEKDEIDVIKNIKKEEENKKDKAETFNQEEKKLIDERKNKIKKLWNNREGFIISGILILALIIRLYFLNIAKNQTHWWDTLAYGNIAKNMIYHLWDNSRYIINEAVIRPPVIPFLWSWLLRFNASDGISIFFLEVIPSIASVFFVFLIIKELYGKRVAYLASFILAFSWIHLFYTMRVMTDVPSLALALASIYFFVKSYDKINVKHFSIAIFLLIIAFLTRYVYAILGILYLIFMISHHKHKLFINKKFYIGGIIGASPLILFFTYNLFTKGNIMPATSVYSAGAENVPFAFHTLKLFPHVVGNVWLPLMILGFIITLLTLIIGFGRISKIKLLQAHSFNILLFVGGLIYFIFFLRAAEDRYLFMIFLPILAFASLGTFYIYDFIKNYSKEVAVILLIILMIIGGITQFKFADQMIKSKINSYAPMKDAFLWVKDNTAHDAVFLGMGAELYAIFYADRPVDAWPLEEDFDEEIEGVIERSDYLVINSFHPTSPKIIDYINANLQDKLSPVYATYFDEAQTQPAVIIYKITKENVVLIKEKENYRYNS